MKQGLNIVVTLVMALLASSALAQESRPFAEISDLGTSIYRVNDELRAFSMRWTGTEMQFVHSALTGIRVLKGTELALKSISKDPANTFGGSGPLAFQFRRSGGWRLCSSFGKGGGKGFLVWTSSSDLKDIMTSELATIERVLTVGLVASQSIYVPTESVPKGHLLHSVWGCQPFEVAGRVHVVGSGEGFAGVVGTTNSDAVIWCAELATRADSRATAVTLHKSSASLVGTMITEGTNPRLVEVEGTQLLGVRGGFHPHGATAPLMLYRSSNGTRWTKDELKSGSLQVSSNYVLAIDEGRLWAGWTIVDKKMRVAHLYKFDETKKKWAQVATFAEDAIVENGKADAKIWLVPSGTESGPIVIVRNAKGEWEKLR